ncbi:TetR family transcriptional regulator [Nonomuraea sp. SMC257]|uniref:TetR family transcriptional regulator n=1 Tax=Nonomuraea montanisoli TaxID=2741721 RepID=A0A7Y6M578_9ACTN|nr:TetR/AcrR family transcriptional regulator [Nonomuraea montanisoli]NUW34265.1 TetR family transcriptional regulator [Nonomuraea montanisoli]
MRRTQAERTRATTGELVEAAGLLFGRDGYAATSIDDVARGGGLTKGAVYHHFSGKVDLFRAVFVREQERLTTLIAAAALRPATGADGANREDGANWEDGANLEDGAEGANGADPLAAVRRGARAFLLACAEPETRRIVLLDGPAVLGWDEVRRIEYGHTLRLLREGLAAAADAGRIEPGDVTVRAHLLFGALCEGAMLVARADDPGAALTEVLARADALIASLASLP